MILLKISALFYTVISTYSFNLHGMKSDPLDNHTTRNDFIYKKSNSVASIMDDYIPSQVSCQQNIIAQNIPVKKEENPSPILPLNTSKEIVLKKEFEAHETWIHAINNALDGKILIVASEENCIKILDGISNKPVLWEGNKPFLWEGNAFFVISSDSSIIISAHDKMLDIVDVFAKSKTSLNTNHIDSISALALIENKKTDENKTLIIAVGSCDKTISIYDISHTINFQILEGHTDTIYVLTALPHQKQLLSGSKDATIKLWNIETGTCVRTFTGHTDAITCIVHIPNKEIFISGSTDQSIKFWNLDNKKCLKTIKSSYGTIMSMVLTPNSRHLIVGSLEMVHIYDLSSMQCIKTFKGADTSMYALTLSPNRNELITTSYKSLKIWDISSLSN